MKISWHSIRKVYSQHVHIRLIVYFLLILIPLVAVSLFSNYRSKDILEDQINKRTESSLQASLDHIDLMLEDLNKLAVLISTDYSIKPILYQANAIPLPTDLFGFYSVKNRLTDIKEAHGNIRNISILHVDSNYLISSEYGGITIQSDAYSWFAEVKEASGKPIMYLPDESDEGGQLFGMDTVSFMSLMDLNERDRKTNVLILTLDRSTLEGLISGVLPTPHSSVYLLSLDERVVASSSRTGETFNRSLLSIGESKHTNDGMLMWRTPSAKSDWSLVLVQPEKELYLQSSNVQTFTYWIIAVSIVLALLISLVVYKGIASPLSTLLYGMKQIRLGKYDTRLKAVREDQFGVLTDAFNQMIAEQQLLINDVYEHQLHLSRTELKFLQSQINPHFLYNTLDSIYWKAKNYDAEEISDMVMNLSKFFRLSLNKEKETFTVEETIAHMQYYLTIQKYRLLDRLEVNYDIAPESRPVPVLKLLLQPIVENAILHGLEKRRQGGRLTISSRIKQDTLELKVADNGPGIPEDRLAFIREKLEQIEGSPNKIMSASTPIKELFGLRNVAGRMKLYYKDGAKLMIDSQQGEGTSVTLIVPIESATADSSD